MTDLVTKDHFTDLRTKIAQIKKDNKLIVFDYEADEKEARSYIFKLRQTKKPINERHKEKKAWALAEGKKCDAGKNELIADLDQMIEFHDKPLRDIKEKKEAEAEIERKRIEFELDWDIALEEDALFNREREMRLKEEAQAKVEAERLTKEKAEQEEKDRLEYEAKVKKDAEDKAKKDAEDALFREQQEKARLINEAADREKQVKIDAENAEQKRLQDIKDTEERSAREQQEAIDKLKAEQEAKEKAETKRIEDEKKVATKNRLEAERIELARQSDVEHRRDINRRIINTLAKFDIAENTCQDIITAILRGEIPNTEIKY